MTTEYDIAVAIQALIQAQDIFAPEDVTLNDYDPLSGPAINAPFAIIRTADEFQIQFRVVTPEQDWAIPVEIFEAFDDHDVTGAKIGLTRQAIIDAIAGGTGLSGLVVRQIRSGTEILPVYRTYVPDDEQADMLPDFLMQQILIDCEVF